MGDEMTVVTEITEKHLPRTHRAFLFGSRATGTNRAHSDYDLGVVGPRPLTPREWGVLHDELEEARIIHAVDVVDFAYASEDFKKHALEHVVPIVERRV